ncbi:AIM24 family protein [Halobacillus litoralis]|uniref:AIM24 family protein n=1 Tax=Halobacillus litoralis TaxID=45668 RepID=A0A845DW61_9BACI|nr:MULTISPECIES: AIM24 family protein [Halobacillus]MYL21358.1 AIM24 family protein [Halobacillus litoralis]MYL30185.1 AIM24 family protein [Halobacillus halophilus]MYL38190.1 AIM24 family protein [Halobacillus litoralis]
MADYSIEEFIRQTKQDDSENDYFELETQRILEVNLLDQVWAKSGAMISYNGNIKFEREGILEHGVGKMFKKALTGEGSSLMKATGRGRLYLADQGKKITIFDLDNETITVNGNDLLAFEPSIDWDIKLMKKVAGMVSGGLFNVTLNGSGRVAITSHYEPLTLLVRPGEPVITDPHATVAWSGHLEPNFKTDVSFKTFIGRGSGESIQMQFEGDGFVIVQPYEEIYTTGSQ